MASSSRRASRIMRADQAKMNVGKILRRELRDKAE